MRPGALLLAMLVGTTALAQEGVNLERRCFGTTWESRVEGHGHVGSFGNVGDVGTPVPSGSTVANSSASSPLSGGGTSSGGGGGGGGEVLLIAAVVVVAALPIILYALDADADEEAVFRWGCPSFQVGVLGGAATGAANSSAWVPMTGVRMTFLQGPIGFDGSWEGTLDGGRTYGAMDAHLLLRPKPKKHVELMVSLGVRRVVFGGAERNGLEVGLPHKYVLMRLDGRPMGLEINPSLFVGQRGLDAKLEAGVVVPAGPLTFRAGGRLYSFDHDIRAMAHAGLSFGL